MALRDLLLSLALTDLFHARWTSRIQDEWVRSLLRKKPHWADAIQRTRQSAEQAVDDWEITDYEPLTAALSLPDPDDRHVLAAAIAGRVDVIVTKNLRHFPSTALMPYKIDAQHPDQFVSHVLTLHAPKALAAVREMRARLKSPPISPEDLLERLARQELPQTVTILRENIALI